MQTLIRAISAMFHARSPASTVFPVFMLTVMLSASAGVAAETARREDGDDAMRKAQYLLRQMTAEQQALKTDNAKLQSEIQDLKAENERLTADLGERESTIARNRKSNDALVERIQSDSDKYHDLVERYRNKLEELRTAQFRVAYLEQAVIERNQWIDVCKASNDDLYQANSELLELYQNRGVLDLLAGAEPVTGLARVRTESLVEDYRYKLEDLKMPDFTDSATAPSDDTATASTQP
jgi:septal ring factor EnvC (AmiA/AmiB activator)